MECEFPLVFHIRRLYIIINRECFQVVPDLEVFQKQNRNDSSQVIELPIPRCIHAHYSPAGGTEDSPEPPESFLVLENLGPRGFEGAEFSRGLTLKQAEAALNAVARLHSLSLTLKVKESKPLSDRYPFLFQTARATDSYQQLGEYAENERCCVFFQTLAVATLCIVYS